MRSWASSFFSFLLHSRLSGGSSFLFLLSRHLERSPFFCMKLSLTIHARRHDILVFSNSCHESSRFTCTSHYLVFEKGLPDPRKRASLYNPVPISCGSHSFCAMYGQK